MKNLKKIAISTILTFSLGALAFGSYSTLTDTGAVLMADSSDQFNEGDVG